MKKISFILPLLFFTLFVQISKAQIDPDAFYQFKSQTTNLSPDGLETLYPRSLSTYFKGYNKTPDFDNVAYLDSVKETYSLTSDELNLLKQNHFFVTERLSRSTFANALHEIYINDLPVFVSTDIILDAVHRSYSYLLKTLEREVMSQNIEQFIAALYENFLLLQQKYNNQGLDESLADVDLYVSIAHSLITNQNYEPRLASTDFYRTLMDGIESCNMVELSLFCKPERSRKLDFSQFKVRGHYVYSETDRMMSYKSLEPYFKTQMWLGRIEFFLTPSAINPWENPWSDEEIQRMNVSAFLLNELVNMTNEKHLFEINEQIINYLVGESDNITPEQYTRFLSNQEITDATQITNSSLYEEYQTALMENAEFEQLIMGGLLYSNPNTEQADTLPVSYRLSGQRYVIDSHILSNMVYDRIVYNNHKIFRGMPSPLDALFALGNNDAYYFLSDELETYKYASNLANMRYLTDNKEASFWKSGYYHSWLGAIRCLNTVDDENLPFFMLTSAWHQQKMNTQLASWTQLRHDNVLYAKPSYTGMTGCSYPHSYVEPYPEFYKTIADFTRDLASFLNTIDLGGWESVQVVSALNSIPPVLDKLEIIAIKELNGTPLIADETDWLKRMLFEDGMSGNPPYSGWYADLLLDPYNMLESDFLVVDVHTQPTLENGELVGKVLHVATGAVNLGTFILQNPETESYMAYIGPFFSCYDTITYNFERLTDEDWEAAVMNNSIPSRPEWTSAFLANKEGQASVVLTELPSKMLIVSDIESIVNQSKVECFPNPVKNVLNIRVPSICGRVSYQLISADGKHIESGYLTNYSMLDFSSFKKGLYLLHLNDENINEIKKIVKY